MIIFTKIEEKTNSSFAVTSMIRNFIFEKGSNFCKLLLYCTHAVTNCRAAATVNFQCENIMYKFVTSEGFVVAITRSR